MTQTKYVTFHEFYEEIVIKYNNVFVTLPTIPWNVTLFQRPQHMATAFAKLGFLSIYTSMYIEDDYVINIPKQNTQPDCTPVEYMNYVGNTHENKNNTKIHICEDDNESENVKPKYNFSKLADNLWLVNMSDDIFKIKGAYYSIYSTAYAINYFNYYNMITKNRAFLIYEYIDAIDERISGTEDNCKKLFINKNLAFDNYCDLVVASSDLLYDEASLASVKNVGLVKNGVSNEHYHNKRKLNYTLPNSYILFKQKYTFICGYFGAIAPWLDYHMLNKIVKLRKDIGFVIIGPDYQNCLEKLPHADNFLYLGSIPYDVLPYYAYNFDICFIPFAEGEIAKTTSPLKLYEYFAMRKPVIASSYMNECIKYPGVFRYTNVDDFSCAIDSAIYCKDDLNYQSELQDIAYQNDWNNKASEYSTILKNLKYTKKPKIPQLILIDDKQFLMEEETHSLLGFIRSLFYSHEFANIWGLDTCAISCHSNIIFRYDVSHIPIKAKYHNNTRCLEINKPIYKMIWLHIYAQYEKDLIISINGINRFTIKMMNQITRINFYCDIYEGDIIRLIADKNTIYIPKFMLTI